MLNGSAQGVIVMAATSQPLIVLGANSFEDENGLWDGDDNHGFCSVVAYNADFIAEVKNAGASGLSMQYASVPRNGSFMGVGLVVEKVMVCATHCRYYEFCSQVTIDGLVEEMGAPLNPDLMLLGWQAQGEKNGIKSLQCFLALTLRFIASRPGIRRAP